MMEKKVVIVSDAVPICQEIKHETVVLSANGITNGEDTQEQNGIGLATNQFKQYYTIYNCIIQ